MSKKRTTTPVVAMPCPGCGRGLILGYESPGRRAIAVHYPIPCAWFDVRTLSEVVAACSGVRSEGAEA